MHSLSVPSTAAAFCAGAVLAATLFTAQRTLANPYLEDLESGAGQFDFDETLVRPWIEKETPIPDKPDPKTLVPLRISGLMPGLKLLLDVDRATVDSDDQVVRLWVVLRGNRGAENATYEGYRCSTGEYKVFAYATPRRDPPITRTKRPVWRKVKDGLSTDYRRQLMRSYLCGIRGARPPTEIRESVRRGEPGDPFLFH